MTKELHIREFKDSDYSHIAMLEEAFYPDKKHSEEFFRFRGKNG